MHLAAAQTTSPLAKAAEPPAPKILPWAALPDQNDTISHPPFTESTKEAPAEPETMDNYVSKVSILTSSIPFYHNQFMAQRKKSRETGRNLRMDPKAAPRTDEADPYETVASMNLDANPRLQSPEEQAETARRLKPNSLSSLQLQHIVSQPLAQSAAEEVKDAKKHRTRWQFGIRSRNLPHEAMHCVYKALLAQGAQWEVTPPPEELPTQPPQSYPVHVHGATRINETMHPSRSASPEHGKPAPRKEQPKEMITRTTSRTRDPRTTKLLEREIHPSE